MFQLGCCSDSAHLGLDESDNILFDLPEIIGQHFGRDLPDNWQFGLGLFFLLQGLVVIADPATEGFEVDGLAGVVGYRTHKFAGGQRSDAGDRDRVDLAADLNYL